MLGETSVAGSIPALLHVAGLRCENGWCRQLALRLGQNRGCTRDFGVGHHHLDLSHLPDNFGIFQLLLRLPGS